MDIDPETGPRTDGVWCASKLQSQLAEEWLKLVEQIKELDLQLRAAQAIPELLKRTQERMRASLDRLAEVERRQRVEQKPLNELRSPEQHG